MLDLVIGMAFIFLMLSLICTAFNEIIEGVLKLRAIDLEQGIRELLKDPKGIKVKALYDHPLIYGLFRGEYDPQKIRTAANTKDQRYERSSDLPSYIPSRTFALAMIDLVQSGKLVDPHVHDAIRPLIAAAGGDLNKSVENIELWFNSSMDRVSGWYKRRVQKILFWMGFAIAVAMNADTVAIFKNLVNDRPLLNSIVATAIPYVQAQNAGQAKKAGPAATPEQAKQNGPSTGQAAPDSARVGTADDTAEGDTTAAAGSPRTGSAGTTALAASAPKADSVKQTTKTAIDSLKANLSTLMELGLPIGWGWKSSLNNNPEAVSNFYAIPVFHGKELSSYWIWLLKLFGWALTGLAISLGSPFWFDVLNKFMVVRSTVKPTEKSINEGSEDRQNK